MLLLVDLLGTGIGIELVFSGRESALVVVELLEMVVESEFFGTENAVDAVGARYSGFSKLEGTALGLSILRVLLSTESSGNLTM